MDATTPRQQRRARRAERRIAQAEALRRKAFSPLRIAGLIAGVPLVATALTVSIFIRTSEFSNVDAVRHLYALAGCDHARKVGLAPAAKGFPGYHPRYDVDGNGIACEGVGLMTGPRLVNLPAAAPVPVAEAAPEAAPLPEAETPRRMDGGAKFLRP
ncbi:excalibur calcium-binding domain-containing protein [Psychromarinibacter sp. S121]|uniref:excalibur calcium-binding domain-containing protein n=1 Tax=Psychromarinibacter sp. S121 TaxID=3415127 RepID=UPI003C7D1676